MKECITKRKYGTAPVTHHSFIHLYFTKLLQQEKSKQQKKQNKIKRNLTKQQKKKKKKIEKYDAI